MLEVRNLSKIYRSKAKNGADTKALDGVSLQFPEKGMVFLLGKSGSGKSTLLNICGGLDSPTDGEIIVKGRSSKDFSQSDFDSYRNTFVGFIFQEYNILNEFSVEDNIALALELQGKPKNKKVIAELLEQVDLTGFAKRKPNTLSGGQRQRIAIARALIKEPEIIMADEPTGALDSNTGKQVFDTLKKLSKDKLVIIVSHDRDFAEQYGDRIIELKDGKILTDVSKSEEEQKRISDNVNAVGDVLCIRSGAELGDKDFEQIKEFLRKSKGDVVIAANEKEVETFKKVSRINDSGGKEIFVDTDTSKKSEKKYSPEDSRFIRSKLPAKHAVKIGVSGLKSKPFRLFLTVLLCVVSFVLLGVLTTLNFYDSQATFNETMSTGNHELVTLKKDYLSHVTWYTNGQKDYDYSQVGSAKFSPAEVEQYKQVFGNDVFGGAAMMLEYGIRSQSSRYWVNNINSVIYLPEGNSIRNSIIGEYPSADDEICVSTYIAEVLYNCKFNDDNGNTVELGSSRDVIGKTVNINGQKYKVVGIVDSGEISSEYESLKTDENNDVKKIYEFEDYLSDGLHTSIFFGKSGFDKFLDDFSYMYSQGGVEEYRNAEIAIKPLDNGEVKFDGYSNVKYVSSSALEGKTLISINGKTNPSADEVIVSHRVFFNYLGNELNDYANGDQISDSERNEYYSLGSLCYNIASGGEWKYDESEKGYLEKWNKDKLLEEIQKVISVIKTMDIRIGFRLFDNSTGTTLSEAVEYSVIAIEVSESNSFMDTIYFTDSNVNSYWEHQKGVLSYYYEVESSYKDADGAEYSMLYVPFDRSDTQINKLWEVYSNTEYADDESRIVLNGSYIDSLKSVDSMVQSLSKVFLYVGLIFALFAILLFSNFISVSISQKKKEIGILRAVGARSTDVFKIFFSESFVIAVICIVISTIASVVLCSYLNTLVAANLGAAIFVFGIVSFVVLVAIALFTAIVATFLPVWNAARKKPVDSIRSL